MRALVAGSTGHPGADVWRTGVVAMTVLYSERLPGGSGEWRLYEISP
jgi:quinol-cytochrome oxidoreductase complex cytochrome b subunit